MQKDVRIIVEDAVEKSSFAEKIGRKNEDGGK